MKKSLIEAKALSINVQGNQILKDGWFSICEGELVAFCQAGQFRSFFPAILNAPNLSYSGELRFKGRVVNHKNPIAAAYILGTNMLVESMSIIENLAVIRNGNRNRFFYDPHSLTRMLRYFLREIQFPIDLDMPLSQLSVSQKYILLLVKAVLLKVPVIVLDNIAQQCAKDDYEWILGFISNYKEKGFTFVLLLNTNNYLVKSCDRIYFCRGRYISDLMFREAYSDEEFEHRLYGAHQWRYKLIESKADHDSSAALEIKLPEQWRAEKTLTIYRGEVFGFLDSYGTQIPQIFQMFQERFPYTICGKECKNYREACAAGLAVASMHRSMLFEHLSFEENLMLLKMKETSKLSIRNKRIEKYYISRCSSKFSKSIEQREWNWECLKLLIYRWMLTQPKVIIIEDPPFDMEEEQQVEFLELLQTIIDSQCAVILISSAKNECRSICDRVLEIKERIV